MKIVAVKGTEEKGKAPLGREALRFPQKRKESRRARELGFPGNPRTPSAFLRACTARSDLDGPTFDIPLLPFSITSVRMESNLVAGREKRSTAGNRLMALLTSQFESEEAFMEVENDEEFVAKHGARSSPELGL